MDNTEVLEKLRKKFLGTRVNCVTGAFTIDKIRYAKSIDMFIAYNKDNWCCNVDILRSADGKYDLMEVARANYEFEPKV